MARGSTSWVMVPYHIQSPTLTSAWLPGPGPPRTGDVVTGGASGSERDPWVRPALLGPAQGSPCCCPWLLLRKRSGALPTHILPQQSPVPSLPAGRVGAKRTGCQGPDHPQTVLAGDPLFNGCVLGF